MGGLDDGGQAKPRFHRRLRANELLALGSRARSRSPITAARGEAGDGEHREEDVQERRIDERGVCRERSVAKRGQERRGSRDDEDRERRAADPEIDRRPHDEREDGERQHVQADGTSGRSPNTRKHAAVRSVSSAANSRTRARDRMLKQRRHA